jgi:hypothetical protein
MNNILHQPVELIDEDLDEVAGGYFNFNVYAQRRRRSGQHSFGGAYNSTSA